MNLENFSHSHGTVRCKSKLEPDDKPETSHRSSKNRMMLIKSHICTLQATSRPSSVLETFSWCNEHVNKIAYPLFIHGVESYVLADENHYMANP